MAYDEQFAARIRSPVGDGQELTEQKMFGGLAFLFAGNTAVAASGQGGILVRVDPGESETLVATTSARPLEMRGSEMHGWLRVRRRTCAMTGRWWRGSRAAPLSLARCRRSASRSSEIGR